MNGKEFLETMSRVCGDPEFENTMKKHDRKKTVIKTAVSKGPAGTVKQCAINEVDFSVPAGFYSEPQSVELTAREGYEIFYTLDGTDPKESETRKLYNAPISLADSTSLGTRRSRRTATSSSGALPAPRPARNTRPPTKWRRFRATTPSGR